ncbi:MAG: hypothetical protein F4151_01165 [Gammaproteobacteria bacterium]|nr:hypothetical protein [Gammaproteobacteria bacterium]
MLRQLNSFYESNGISPVHFRCRWRSACCGESAAFTEAKASYVGPFFEERCLPRLLFLSLDPGGADPRPRERTIDAVRRQNLAMDVEALHPKRHWYLTHELAFALLRQFKAGLTVPDTRLYFAHVQSAKCSNRAGKEQASRTLFENCRPFILPELKILKPDIVVTQGNPAVEAILKGGFAVRQHVRRTVNGARYETAFLELDRETRCLWLQTYHPGARSHFHRQRTHCWPLYAMAVAGFWEAGTEARPSR